MIVKEKGLYIVRSERTGRVFGRYKTKKEAAHRLRQIEIFKHIKPTNRICSRRWRAQHRGRVV